jgi:ribosomal protein L7/L12
MQQQEKIAALAYQRFLARGGEHGHDVEDWIAAEAEVTRTPYDVILVRPGANTIELVRVLREMTGKNLTEVRALVDRAPVIVKRAPYADAVAARQMLASFAQVDVRPARSS